MPYRVSDQSRRRSALAASTADNLMPTAVGLCLFYGVITVLHLLLLPAPLRVVMVPVAASSSLVTGVLALLFRRHRPIRDGSAWVALMGLIAMSNSLLHLAITGAPEQTTTVMMSVTLVAAVLHDPRWSAGVIGYGIVGWLAVALTAADRAGWLHYCFAMVMTVAIACFLHYSRARTVLRLADAELRLHRTAVTDELTGLLNRRGLLVRGEQVMASGQQATRAAALFVDLDDLKLVNDRHGHDEGDRLIRAVARVLTEVTPGEAVVARWGGDEFAVLLPDADDLTGLVERLHARLEQDGIRASIGAASEGPRRLDADRESTSELLSRADSQMYRHKHARRGLGDPPEPPERRA